LNISVLIFSVSSMLAVGFSYTLREIIEPLRDLRGVFLALAANFVIVPFLAFLLTRLLSLEPALAIGLFLVATAAGAPFLIKLAQLANGDLAFATTLLVLLVIATIFYMPAVVPVMAPAAKVSALAIASRLALTMLLPLGLGLLIDRWFEPLADRMLPVLNKVSSGALVVLVAMTVVINYRLLLGVFGTGAILAALLLTASAFGTGYLLGGADPDERSVIALGTAQRNIAAATVVATQNFDDPRTLVMVVVTSIVSMAFLLPIAKAMGRRNMAAVEATGRHVAARKSPAV
jgi:BASS family bile acid:Na+ symporter